MKNNLRSFLSLILIGITLQSYAQSSMSYQGLVLDATGNELISTGLDIRISIYDDLAGTTTFYEEEHTTTTKSNGAFQVDIGSGTLIGGIHSNIIDVPWGSGVKFLNVQYRETLVGGAYFDLGTTQFYAVPFAFHSNTTDQVYSIEDLTDVDTTGIQVGHALVWDGMNWVTSTIDTVSFAFSSDSALYSDTAEYAFAGNQQLDTANFSFNSDSSNFSLSSGYSDTSGYALHSDTAQFATNVLNSWDLNGNIATDSSFIGSIDSSDVRIMTNGTDRMIFKASGKIGIGVSDPMVDFDVQGENGMAIYSSHGAGLSQSFSGDRMVWYPKKSYFYAGGGPFVQNDGHMGNYSAGFGFDVFARGDYSMAVGYLAQSRGDYSFAGGYLSEAVGDYSFSFGFDSETLGECAVGMGRQAFAHGTASIALGYHPLASGAYSMSCGYYTEATDTSSFALGYRSQSLHKGSFVWSDASTSTPFVSTGENQFLVRAGRTKFFTHNSLASGVELVSGAGAWSSISDSAKKKNIIEVDNNDILSKLDKIGVYEWNYITQDDSIIHIGPMAQDFKAVFGYGESELMINTVDIDGVNLAALKALAEKAKSLEAKLSYYQNIEDKYEQLLMERQEIQKVVEDLEKRYSQIDKP